MKKALIIGIISLGVLFGIPGISHAERIKDFSSNIDVLNDSTVMVTETIVYDFEGASHHGIFRTIPLENQDGSMLGVDSIIVSDEKGVPYQESLSENNGDIMIKIGSPSTLVSGVKTYRISYVVKNALVSFDTYDELYWNITGDQWSVPIDHVAATVATTPKIIQSSCYRGNFGSSEKCTNFKTGDMTVNENNINPGEGVTVAVGMTKGIISGITRIGGQVNNNTINRPEPTNRSNKIILTVMALIVVGITIIIRVMSRDKKSKNPIMAQYEPPRGFTPIQAGVVIDKDLDFRDITAQIINLAERGYITITYLEKKELWVFNVTDYQFTLIKQDTGLDVTDQKIMKFIFGDTLSDGISTTLNEMSDRSHMTSKMLFDEIQKDETDYFITQGFFEKNKLQWIMIILPMILVGGMILSSTVSITAIVTTVIIGIIGMTVHPRKMTFEGADAKQELLGFKEFLAMTDKDRFDFHNAPEKKPEHFMQYLPYAIAFRVEEKWVKQFEGMMVPEPKWYHGSTSRGFSPQLFTASMMSIGTALGATATVARSGSGGGGFSGGGSGGGGGGSW